MASVDAHLRDIADLADDQSGGARGRALEDHEYREALEAMRALGGESALDRFAADLKESIRESGTLPREQSVRSLGRDVCDREGYEIPPDSWFAR